MLPLWQYWQYNICPVFPLFRARVRVKRYIIIYQYVKMIDNAAGMV
jgi:hypothetical protein